MVNRAKSCRILTDLLSLTLLSISFLIGLPSAIAQSWDDLVNRGYEARKDGRYKQAEKFLESALAKAQSFGEQDARLAATLRELANVYLLEKKYNQAGRLFERELSITRSLGEYYPGSAYDLLSLGKIKEEESNYLAAQRFYERAMQVKERNNFKGDDEELDIVWHLARNFAKQGKYEDAAVFFDQALALRPFVTPKMPRLPVEIDEVAANCDKARRYKEAEHLLGELVPGFQQTRGAKHPETVKLRIRLGESMFHQGETEKARQLCEDLLQIANQWCSQRSSDLRIADCLTYLGRSCLLERDPKEACKLLKAAVATVERGAGPDAKETASVLGALGDFYMDQHDYSQALACYKRGFAICEKSTTYVSDTAEFCCRLAAVYCMQKEYLQAEPFASRAMNEFAKRPENRKDYLRALRLYADLLKNTNRSQQASQVTSQIQTLERQAPTAF
jgi:tetratricopeptide (TPR) repeat protein